MREELGLEVEVGDILAAVYHTYPEGPVLLLAYTCRLREADRLQERPGTQSTGPGPGPAESRWVLIGELDRYRFAPADLPVVQKLQRRWALKQLPHSGLAE